MSELSLIPPRLLRPTEETVRGRIGEVIALILTEQAWTQPICVERDTLAVLDGHHRLAAAIQLGLARVPVRLYAYATVPLASWRPGIVPTRGEVLRRALAGHLYPPKTTRHRFAPEPPISVALAQLLGEPVGASTMPDGTDPPPGRFILLLNAGKTNHLPFRPRVDRGAGYP
ncbi:ParB-like nuclease domain-containing protein [Methylobacterium sp. ap11]|uniref:ParB N-terminal domain-containing protein n=1 Tax=Methylobacterium sp. ap11 TaxID=1761799 RepID=UPI0008D56111|nr:ParB N-terminal domain-containing protein [Methylobacterium sp. ap11]SEP50523.1 ParB-like nuclease domain-containing protein [Methylobacterium sp. ap11]